MKQLKEIKRSKLITIIAIVLIIIVGVIITCTIGFNVKMQLREHKQIQLYLGKEFKETDIKQITNEVLKEQEVVVQKVEVFEDTVLISTNEITEEQKTNLVLKINEKYGTELKTEQQEVQTVPRTRIRNLLSSYITIFMIATAIIIIYFIIRYRKLNFVKVVIQTILTLGISELLLFSVIAITRIPVGKITVLVIFAIYVLALAVLTNKYENKLQKIKLEELSKSKKGK